MCYLNAKQRQHFVQSLRQRQDTDPTYLLLKDCTDQLYRIHAKNLSHKRRKQFRAYKCAFDVLYLHGQYLAYQLGLEHGKTIGCTDAPICAEHN